MHRLRAHTLAIASLGFCLVAPAPSAAEPVLVPSGPQGYAGIEKTPVEFGVRYWVSSGEARWAIDSSSANSLFGNPTSVLHYEDLDARTIELTLRIDDQGWFFKGTLGGGWIDGGTLDDEDYFAGGIKFSDTLSEVKGDHIGYGTIDLGKTLHPFSAHPNFSLGIFLGVAVWRENATANGAVCNPDDVGGYYCGPPGSVAIADDVKVIKNEANWTVMRIGLEARWQVADWLMVFGEVAALPVASLYNEDSHFLRLDLGPTPNIEHDGWGYGVMAEAGANIRVTPALSFGGGVRYWEAKTDGRAEFADIASVRLNEFRSERFGAFADLTYKFWIE